MRLQESLTYASIKTNWYPLTLLFGVICRSTAYVYSSYAHGDDVTRTTKFRYSNTFVHVDVYAWTCMHGHQELS